MNLVSVKNQRFFTLCRLIETAKANGLNVYTYLEYLLWYMPDTDYHNHPDVLELLMP